MKLLRVLLAAGVSLGAMTAAARADPVSIGFFLFAGPLGGVFSFGALVTAAQVGLYAAAIGGSLLVSALANRQSRVDPGQYRNTFETAPENSEVNAIGRVRVSGLKIFGNTISTRRYRLIGHAASLLDGVETYELGGREVAVEPNGDVSSPPYAYIGGSYVNIQSKTGDGTETAWSSLTTDFPTLWTSAHRVRGIAQTLVRYVSPGVYTDRFGQMYQGGEPELTILARFNTAYDPREVGHDPDDDSTWEWTDNGVLCAARIMLDYPDLTVDDFDWDFIADEADRADVLVDTLTGTEKRARCSGIWLSEAKRGDTMQDVLDSIGAEIVMSDAGLVRIRLIDDDPTGEIALTERHTTEFTWGSGPEAVERPNVCRVSYYSPERNYEMADIDLTGIAWARIDDEITRYGEKVYDIELPFCPSASQAQRIARRMFLTARADTGTCRTNMAGLAAWGLTYATIAFPDLDESPVCKIASPRVDEEAGEVDIPFLVWPSELIDNPYDETTMEAPAPDTLPDLSYPAELDTPDAPVSAMMVTLPSAAKQLRVAYSLPAASGATVVEAVYREVALAGPFLSMTEYGDPQGDGVAVADVDKTGDPCEFKVRIWNGTEGSYFSDVLAATPANDSAVAPDDPTIEVTQVGSSNTAMVKVTQSPSIQATYVNITGSGAPGLVTLAPFETYEFGPISVAPSTTETWYATAYNSAAVASSTVSDGFTAPGA